MCIRDVVAPGEFLSYDYQFDTNHADKFLCMCGAAKCRGTMKGGKLKDDKPVAKKSMKDQLREARTKLVRDTEYVSKVRLERYEALDQTDVLVPANSSQEEFVANGPNIRNKEFIQEKRIALWRNLVTGGDIVKRIKM